MAALSIWMNGELVGAWRVGRTGHHRLQGDVVRNYFDNLCLIAMGFASESVPGFIPRAQIHLRCCK